MTELDLIARTRAALEEVARMHEEITALQAELDERDITIGELQAALSRQRRQQENAQLGPSPEELRAWVDGWLRRNVERSTGSAQRWCSSWEEHPEAVMRLGVMHRDFTRAMSTPDLGIGAFLRNTLDYHLPLLLAANGPFSACDTRRHEEPVFLG